MINLLGCVIALQRYEKGLRTGNFFPLFHCFPVLSKHTAACLLRRSQRAGGIMGKFLDALQQSGDARSGYLQFGEGEHLFAEVFQGGTDMIDVRAVNYQL